MKKVRTRYAPSPTGRLHIGGARTAILSYLFAKHFNGKFIVRIEDTDLERNVINGEKNQLENLKWLGLKIDESPENPNPKYGQYKQSKKITKYQKIIQKLLEEKKAYKAFDNNEELIQQKKEQMEKGIISFRYDKNWLKISQQEQEKREIKKEYTIRFKLTSNKIYEWNDIVRGKIIVNTNDIGDFIIQKQNGYPTYNFAVVVDDHDMEISHILRGEEHIANTPKQLAIYEALNWKVPQFGHLSIITDYQGKKLSKRNSQIQQFIEEYKNEGYHPHAIFNFLTLLGLTFASKKEIMTQEELIDQFDYHRLSKAPSKFDLQKMQWFSKEYIKKIDDQILMKKINIPNKSLEWKKIFINTYKQNAYSLKMIEDNLKIYQNNQIVHSKNYHQNYVVKIFAQEINKYPFTIENIQKAIMTTKQITKANGKDLFMPIRLACTYSQHGPELAKCIYLWGKKIIQTRLK